MFFFLHSPRSDRSMMYNLKPGSCSILVPQRKRRYHPRTRTHAYSHTLYQHHGAHVLSTSKKGLYYKAILLQLSSTGLTSVGHANPAHAEMAITVAKLLGRLVNCNRVPSSDASFMLSYPALSLSDRNLHSRNRPI